MSNNRDQLTDWGAYPEPAILLSFLGRASLIHSN